MNSCQKAIRRLRQSLSLTTVLPSWRLLCRKPTRRVMFITFSVTVNRSENGCFRGAVVMAWTFDQSVAGWTSGRNVIKSLRSTQPSIPSGYVNRVLRRDAQLTPQASIPYLHLKPPIQAEFRNYV